MISKTEEEYFRYRYFGNFDVTNILEKLNKLPDSEWDVWKFRQGIFEEHVHTRTIPLLYDESFSGKRVEHKNYELFQEDIEELEKFLLNFYNVGYIIRMLLVKMNRNSFIPIHRDTGRGLVACHRHHIPLITNDKVKFYVDGQIENMKVGEVWEINNARPHGVKNHSVEDRIHIIADWSLE